MFGLMLAAVLTASAALGAEETDKYTWKLTFMGLPIGEHVLEVDYERTDKGLERVLRSTTTIDATSADFDYQYQMNVAGRATNEPAAFNASVNRNGTTWGNEVRWAQSGIYVTHIDNLGRAEDEVLTHGAATLSTIDLFDPLSRVALSRYESVNIISTEDGEVFQSRVRRTGPTEIIVEGTKLLTEGLVLHAPTGRQAYYYTADGIPVKYEYYVDGRLFEAVLEHLPPPGVDDQPVPMRRPEIVTLDL